MQTVYIGKEPCLVYALASAYTTGYVIWQYKVNDWPDYISLKEKITNDERFIRWVHDYQMDPNYKLYQFVKDYKKVIDF